MCRETKELLSDSPQMSLRTDSTFSYSSDEDCNDISPPGTKSEVQRSLSASPDEMEVGYSRIRHVLSTTFAGMSLGAGILGFSLWFPFFIMPEASLNTFKFAFWSYDESLSRFDNTPWTYGTDYALAVIMAALAFSILKLSRRGVSDRLSTRAASLLLLYMISVTTGGIAHQNYLTLESRNTMSFRLLWTVCVGTVSLANTSMGLAGTEIVRKFQSEQRLRSPMFARIPLIPEYFWWVYGVFVTAFTARGGMSFQRPACDIFIAGTTQAPPTFYMMAVLYFLEKVEFRDRILGMIGFILNAPLLPMYPLLVYYADWSLASVNTLLHCWLCVAWSIQGYSMRHVVQWLGAEERPKQKTC